MIVVLLNLLIAQMSDTYAKTREDVEGHFALARARIIARLQRRKWLLCKEVRRNCIHVWKCMNACLYSLSVKVICRIYYNFHCFACKRVPLIVIPLHTDVPEALLPKVHLDRLVTLLINLDQLLYKYMFMFTLALALHRAHK